jgi:hypothetical protein
MATGVVALTHNPNRLDEPLPSRKVVHRSELQARSFAHREIAGLHMLHVWKEEVRIYEAVTAPSHCPSHLSNSRARTPHGTPRPVFISERRQALESIFSTLAAHGIVVTNDFAHILRVNFTGTPQSKTGDIDPNLFQ